MRYRWWHVALSSAAAFGCLAFLSMTTSAQEAVFGRPTAPNEVVNNAVEDIAPPISPATSPGPMSLDACIDLGFHHQPALDAARASLAAAQTGKRSVDRLLIPRLFVKDLGIRREQACHGVTIAGAGLTQAEWETRYAITRNYFTVQYIRSQGKVINEVLGNLTKARARVQKLFEKPPIDSKITKLDLDAIDIQIALVKGKKSQVDNGMLKALAALREAMGLNHDYPLEIAQVDLPSAVSAIKVAKDKAEYPAVYKFNKTELIASAIANRGEMVQASTINRITDLEIQAQGRIFGWSGKTFASGADIHAKQVPQGIFNNEYRPGAFTIEMGAMLAGRKADRVQRATDLHQRANAVVDKTTNLVSLDVEAQFLKWQEAVEEIQELSGIQKIALELPDKVLKLNPNEFTSQAVIQANFTAIMVRTQLNDAMHMHALALAGLERATAGAFRVYPIPSSSK